MERNSVRFRAFPHRQFARVLEILKRFTHNILSLVSAWKMVIAENPYDAPDSPDSSEI